MINFVVEDDQIKGALGRLMALCDKNSPILGDIAAVGAATTAERFRTQIGPDGKRWKPSLRAQLTGGKTLYDDGHLAQSISSWTTADSANWGIGRVYAAIHQFGGTIKPKNGDALKFKIPGGGFAVVKAVRMPARPFLGLSESNRNQILDLIENRLSASFRG